MGLLFLSVEGYPCVWVKEEKKTAMKFVYNCWKCSKFNLPKVLFRLYLSKKKKKLAKREIKCSRKTCLVWMERTMMIQVVWTHVNMCGGYVMSLNF